MRKRRNRRSIGGVLILVLLVTLGTFPSRAQPDDPFVYTIEVRKTITAGTAELISRAIETAEADGAEAVVLLINTPCGLVDATLLILEKMLAAEVPVITYVSPQGAIAASAGSFILIGGHVAAMSPGTTVGAAMPVTISPTEGATQTADDKTIQFLAGHIRSVANERGRPGEIIAKFVTENLTLDATEALDEGIIDTLSPDLTSLLTELDGRVLSIDGREITLETEGVEILPLEMSASEKVTNLVSNPQVSFLLVILGIYGLIIGFQAPQTFVPEVFGAIALLLGLYGIGMFEVNLFAGLLLVLGVGLLVAEAFTPTYGVLSVGGVIGIVLGALFLPAEPLMPTAWFVSLKYVAFGIGIGASLLLVIMLRGLLKAKNARVVQGDDEFDNLTGVVMERLSPEGLVKVQGEIWRARSNEGQEIKEQTTVRIMDRQGFQLIVIEENQSDQEQTEE